MSLERRIVFLSADQLARLAKLARGRKIAELIREAIDSWLDMREREARREGK